MSTSYPGRVGAHVALVLALAIVASMSGARGHLHGAQAPARPSLETRARAVLAQHSGTIVVNGLKAPVEVLRDTWGIPHIYAQSTEDLFFAQGFVVAQDRMWQLELWRRNGEGRLAEVLGPEYVTRDTFARLLAFRGNWDEEFKKYHPQGRAIFDGFAAGVNAAIQKALDEDRIPVEFDIMGFKPLPVWTAQTVLTRMPGWTLSRNAASEVQRALDIKAMGARKVEELKPTEPKKALQVPAGLDLDDIEPAILDVTRDANNLRWTLGARSPARASSGGAADAASDFASTSSGDEGAPSAGTMASARRLAESIGLSPNPWLDEPDLGSNNWVVSGKLSESGKPLLASDPHRALALPALRYLVHLNAPRWNVIGAGEPAIPGVALGHNERIAWGITIVGVDQADIVVLETDPAQPSKYKLGREDWRPMKEGEERIAVKGKGEVVVKVRSSIFGPIIHQDEKRHRAYALQWTGSGPGGAAYLGGLSVDRASDRESFLKALDAWHIPGLNFMYADVAGNIGWIAHARTPIRADHDGLLPVPAARALWKGFLPVAEEPQSWNPENGWLATANHNILPPGYRHQIGYEFAAPYRFDRIKLTLESKKRWRLGDFRAIQHDDVSIPAQRLIRLLREEKFRDPALKPSFELLTTWDGKLSADSRAGPLFALWLRELQDDFYAPFVPNDLRKDLITLAGLPVMLEALENDDPFWLCSEPRTMRSVLLQTALYRATQALAKLPKERQERWGALHTATFSHPLAQLGPAYARALDLAPVERSGDGNTPLNTRYDDKFHQIHGATYRQLFDLADWDKGLATSAPGQSGQPGSPHYGDLLPLWAKGEYFPLAFSRAKVEEVTAHRLVLRP